MQTQWYGDKRDLVKWGTLVHICREQKIKTIIQVPFLSKENGCPYQLSVDDEPEDFPPAVWKHFKDLRCIKRLGKPTGITIEVLRHKFSHKTRDAYLQKILKSLAQVNGKPKVVFLDPDTGIEPQKAGPEHVKIDEIKAIWRCLQQGDWLVLYQHRWRENRWKGKGRKRFDEACGVPEVKVYHAKKIASDVVFFAARKSQ